MIAKRLAILGTLLGLASGGFTPDAVSSAATLAQIKTASSASRRTDAAPGSTAANASAPLRALIGGGLGHYVGQGGIDRKTWGMSAACARMVRKSRLHGYGIAHAKI